MKYRVSRASTIHRLFNFEQFDDLRALGRPQVTSLRQIEPGPMNLICNTRGAVFEGYALLVLRDMERSYHGLRHLSRSARSAE